MIALRALNSLAACLGHGAEECSTNHRRLNRRVSGRRHRHCALSPAGERSIEAAAWCGV
jgi:hypothetical protein